MFCPFIYFIAALLEENDSNVCQLAMLIDELDDAENCSVADTGVCFQTPLKGNTLQHQQVKKPDQVEDTPNSEGKDPVTPVREESPMCRCRPSMPSQR